MDCDVKMGAKECRSHKWGGGGLKGGGGLCHFKAE